MTPDIVTWLLNDLHTALGVALNPADRSRLTSDPPQSIEALCDAVLMAEGLDPSLHRDRRQQIVTRMCHALVETQ